MNQKQQLEINNQDHYNNHQTRYFFNTYLKVSTVQNYPLHKNNPQGGPYYV